MLSFGSFITVVNLFNYRMLTFSEGLRLKQRS